MAGYPDVEGCIGGRSFTIELKAVTRPVWPATPIHTGLTVQQLAWARRRAQAGGHSFALIQVGSGADACRYLIRADPLLCEPSLTEGTLRDLYRQTIGIPGAWGDLDANNILQKVARII